MNTFSLAVDEQGQRFGKFIVFDEAQKYMGPGQVSTEIIDMIREMRHRRMTVIIATQDPEAISHSVHELSTVTVVHKLRSISSLRVLRQGNQAWDEVTIEDLAAQAPGEAYIATVEASVKGASARAMAARVRPTCAMPGGTTETNVRDDE